MGPAVLWSQFRTSDNETWREAVTGTVGALVGMIPEGLVLLTTLAFLVAGETLGRRQVLVQELPAVEGLARVDVVCLDKTGTLTHGDVRVDRLIPLPTGLPTTAPSRQRWASSPPTRPTPPQPRWPLAATFPSPTPPAGLDLVPFSSARKWSALRGTASLTWVLGAPEMVLPGPAPGDQVAARQAADGLAEEGRPVLLLASSAQPWGGDGGEALLPGELTPRALVVLEERIRDDAAEVLRFFAEQGVALKVISGDNPRTVGAVAAAVGVPGVTGAGDAVDARTLPTDVDELAEALEAHSVFGRVTPHQKRASSSACGRSSSSHGRWSRGRWR